MDTLKCKIDNWIASHLLREHNGIEQKEDGTYWISKIWVNDFCSMLANIDSLIYMPCRIDAAGLLFGTDDIENAEFY